MLNSIVHMVRNAPAEVIEIVQNKRYIDADAISVDRRWYRLYTNINSTEPFTLVLKKEAALDVGSRWLDDNGRWLK